MASNKSVIVLTPHGRRQTVKVTPNTTILQILEEVCLKQGFKANEFDLKHHNHVLDTTSIIRFTGLPNNAQLEMCAAQRTRTETSVTLGVQLENGNRLTGDFIPSDTLWDVVDKLCPEENTSKENLVVIYMRNEVYGDEALKNTSLRSLGLTGGRAMLRVIHRSPEELKTQANVSSVIPVKQIEEKPFVRKQQEVDKLTEQKRNEPVKSSIKQSNDMVMDLIKKEKQKSDKQPMQTNREENMEVDQPKTQTKDPCAKKIVKKPPKIDTRTLDDFEFLGDRNAMAFSMEMSTSVPDQDLPDDFFDLTVADARRIFEELRAQREALEEQPLLTSDLRNLEKSKKVLRHINQYKQSIVRIHFPDRNVLQGAFRPLETIQHVMDFVKEYLHHPSTDFYLFTAPPKTVLGASETLVDLDCVPTAVLYYGTEKIPDDKKYLKDNIFPKFVTPSTASIAASKLISTNKREVNSEEIESDVNVGASTSKALPKEQPTNKVPKWFKSNK